MQNFTNEKKVKRNSILANILTFSGLGILVLCLYISNQENVDPLIYSGLMGGLLAGLLSFQIGMDMKNRWSRKPRMDEILSSAFKGLDAEYSIVHYYLGAKHVFIAPAGIFALVPVLEKGEIIYEDEKLYAVRTGKRRSRKRYINSATVEAQRAIKALRKKLATEFGSIEDLNIEALLIFPHPEAKLMVNDMPLKSVHAKKVKPYFRKLPRAATLSAQQVKTLTAGMTPDSK